MDGPAGGSGANHATPSFTRLRTALTLFFALDGFLFAGWTVRIPAIKQRTGATASTLGLALLDVSAGAVITMMLTGTLCRRYGSHCVTAVCGVLLSRASPAGAHGFGPHTGSRAAGHPRLTLWPNHRRGNVGSPGVPFRGRTFTGVERQACGAGPTRPDPS